MSKKNKKSRGKSGRDFNKKVNKAKTGSNQDRNYNTKDVPDYGYNKEGQPEIYIARSGGYTGSLRIKDDKAQLAVFSNTDRGKIINMIELSEIYENNGQEIYAYGQENYTGRALLADVINQNSVNVGSLYVNNELSFRQITADDHRDCILRTLLGYLFESNYTRKLTGPTEFEKPKPDTERTKILL